MPISAENNLANISVEIDGKTKLASQTSAGEIDTFSGVMITDLSVDLELNSPDMFTVGYKLLVDGELTFIDSILEGMPVSISMGYGSTADMETVFSGEVVYVEPTFRTEGESSLMISGYDRSHRLTRGTQSKSWDDKEADSFDYPGVVDDIVSGSGSHDGGGSDNLALDGMESQMPSFRHVPQLATNDYKFIRSLGFDVGLTTGARAENEGKLQFANAEIGDTRFTICRVKLDGDNPVHGKEVSFRLNTANQVSRVEVRGWDPHTKKNIVGVAETPEVDFGEGGTPATDATADALYGGGEGRKIVVVNHPVYSKDEANAVAQAILEQVCMEFIEGEAVILGEPTLSPGNAIAFKGYGNRFDGRYLVTAVQHSYEPEGSPYICRLKFQRNCVNPA
jgi:phage protein D